MPEDDTPFREATIDLDAVAANTALAAGRVAPASLIADLGADAVGHAAVLCAPAILASGAEGILVPGLDEAVQLRRAGVTAPLISHLHAPGESFAAAADTDVVPAVRSAAEAEACRRAGVSELLLVPETGSGLPGIPEQDWPAVCRQALRDALPVAGILATIPSRHQAGHSEALARALSAAQAAEEAGIRCEQVIAMGGAGTVGGGGAVPGWVTAVCVGAELFGVSAVGPVTPDGFRPAMTLWAPVTGVRQIGGPHATGDPLQDQHAGAVALVPLGYGDGVDRAARNAAPLIVGAHQYTVGNEVAADALVVDLGEDRPPSVGDRAVLFGDPGRGDPAVGAWARAVQVSTAEVTARIAARVRRRA